MPMPMPQGRMEHPAMPRMPSPPMPRQQPMTRPMPQPGPTQQPVPPVRRALPVPAPPRKAENGSSTSRSRSFGFSPDAVRKPAYTPWSYLEQQKARQSASANGSSSTTFYAYQPAAWDWAGYGWGGFGWNSWYLTGLYSCDPFSLLNLYGGPVCFGPTAYEYGFDPFLLNFGLASYDTFSPFSWGSNCLFCSSLSLDPFTIGMTDSFQLDPYQETFGSSSIAGGSGSLSGVSAPGAGDSSLAAPGGELSTYAYATPPLPKTPVTLVLSDGTTVEARQYRLAADGSLHYVTTAGKQTTIPFGRLDMKATMKANRDKGVEFLVPVDGSQPAAKPQ
jgi:hypothetical protein